MTSRRHLIAGFTLAVLGACTADAPPGTAPDNPIRERPAVGFEGLPDAAPYDGGPIAADAQVDPTPCCDVTFAIRADQDEDEVAARLITSGSELVDPIAMERVGEAWQVTTCVPDDYDQGYWFEVGLDVGTGTPFWVRRTNPNVPIDSESGEASNRLTLDEECATDVSAHGTF